MIFVPKIVGYKPFYLQASSDDVAIDTIELGLVAKSNPYPVIPTPKSVYKNEWKDEDGDDEYVDSIRYSSISFSVSFYVKAFDDEDITAKEVILSNMDSFFAKIKEGEFMVYDSYTGIGYRKVRFESYKEESFKSRGNWAKCIFTVTFKVNDPITRMKLGSDGNIIEVQ